ncbi:hypothetical protein ACQKP5_14610 [Pseudomonas vancouverensis]|uniref:hypothetical protein n=1 Tax=Pseudomonas vancouverensis TaxID=95300 RepID=UPI003D065CF2
MAHIRYITAGDSIMTYTFEPGGGEGKACELTVGLIPNLTNVFINNFSGGGQRMCSGSTPGFGLVNEKQAITYINGGLKADGIIIALGINDAGAPEVGAIEFINTLSGDDSVSAFLRQAGGRRATRMEL